RRSTQRRHLPLEELVEHADAAGLHDYVRAACKLQRLLDALLRRVVYDHPRPVRIRNVAVSLTVVGIGFVEGDSMAAAMECAHDPAVIGGRAVPVRGHQTRAEECDVEATAHATALLSMVAAAGMSSAAISRSSSTRWAQVCRARRLRRPCRASSCAASGSARSSASRRSISAPSRATR